MLKAESQKSIGIINCAINPRIPENTQCFSANPDHQLDQLRPNSPPPPIYLANLAQNCSHRRKHRQIFQKNVLLSNFRATSKSFWGTIVATPGGLPMPKLGGNTWIQGGNLTPKFRQRRQKRNFFFQWATFEPRQNPFGKQLWQPLGASPCQNGGEILGRRGGNLTSQNQTNPIIFKTRFPMFWPPQASDLDFKAAVWIVV